MMKAASTPDRTAPTKALWRRARVGTILCYAVAGGTVAAGVILLGDEMGRHLDRFEAWIAGLGPWAPAAFVLLYMMLGSFFVPDVLLGIVAGASFGFARGLAVVAAGSVAGATLQYALSRRLFKPVIDRFLASRPALAAIQTAVRQQQFKLQLIIRLTPLNRALTSYVLGATGVEFAGFAAACVALLPSLCLEVYIGYAGKHVARMTTQSGHALHDVMLIAGLAMAIAGMMVISQAARRALDAAAVAGQKLDSGEEIPSGEPGRYDHSHTSQKTRRSD
jgi:uncharacterized membrane protein YdjX (TVP38/TMEM64 family)